MSDTQQQQSEGASSGAKIITKDQLGEHTTSGDLWLVIDGKVYDVSKFMDEHPGGDEVLISESGRDATEAFEDVGHSDDARALLPPMLVGEIEGGAAKVKKAAATASQAAPPNSNPVLMFIPLLFIGAYVAYKYAA